MQTPKHACFLLTVAFIFLTLTSCHNFYKTASGRSGVHTTKTVDSLKGQNRFFVLRAGTAAYHMKNIVISNDGKTITFTADTLPPEHKLHLGNGHHGRQQYKNRDQGRVNLLNEVHIYVPPIIDTISGEYSLSLDKVQKIEVIEKDTGRTIGSYAIGTVVYSLAAITLASVVYAASGGLNFSFDFK